MPRQPRLDYPGALHHVMVRGIARAPLFEDRSDHIFFLALLERELKRTGARCLAWSLMTNHVHLLIQTGTIPLAQLMHRLLFRYAARFNRKYRRAGHIFQNRYKSMLCDRESYLLELVRYIHLNPLRAGLVSSLEGLARYPWTGHKALMGRLPVAWQDTDEVLAEFSKDRNRARSQYEAFLAEGIGKGRHPELTFGDAHLRGVMADGGHAASGDREAHDPRILGGGDFIAKVVAKVEAAERRRTRAGKRVNPQAVLQAAARVAGVPVEAIQRPGKKPAVAMGRALACKWLVEDLGMQGVAVARLLGVTSGAVSQGIERGRRIEAEKGVAFDRES
ncbi:MAG: transposase [Candidatus Coatesbacteria bacterium]